MLSGRSFGNISTVDHAKTAEIIVKPTKECFIDIAFGTICMGVILGFIYLDGYYKGAKAFDRALFNAEKSLELIDFEK